MKHVVMYSGGLGSWSAAKRVAEKYGTNDLTLLFTDTFMEDEDLYRFLYEGAKYIGGKLEVISDGRDPWKVFFDTRFLGNSRVDPCSRILKRDLSRKWIKENCDPNDTIIYLGIDWTEEHRYIRAAKHWEPWVLKAPLCEPPYLIKTDMYNQLKEADIELPKLYRLGFSHNNCGGFCIKAGQAHFKLLLQTLPERYRYHEEKELELRKYLGRDDISILRMQQGDQKYNVTLREFRRIVESGGKIDLDEWGGCGCFSNVGDDEYEESECKLKIANDMPNQQLKLL